MTLRLVAALALLALPVGSTNAAEPGEYVAVPGGVFESALKYEDARDGVRVEAFELMRKLVTNAQFLAFVRSHAEWRRDRVPAVFAESRYLSHWAAPEELGADARPQQPVTWVSWFAADAYCGAQGARLPTWSEWEYVAAADETRRDARKDAAWRDRILDWYSRPSTTALPDVAQQNPNAYGVLDVHGLVWEWVEDYSAMLVSADNREQGSADQAKFCGAGALSTADRDNYAVLMRIAMLSSLAAPDVTTNLGFRCARDP